MTLVSPTVRAADAPASTPPRPLRSSLFISPVGQPFRAGPGEPYPVTRWFAQVDRNGDGRIDRAEFLADAEAFFRLLDANHDGVIDGFEAMDYEHNLVPEILGAYQSTPGLADTGRRGRRVRAGAGDEGRPGRGADTQDGGAGEAVMGGAEPYELFSLPEPVTSADTNLTGRVTLSDFLAAAGRRFDRLDVKGQGYVTLADLPKTPVQRAAEGKPDGKSKP